jgi:hypothetical protein
MKHTALTSGHGNGTPNETDWTEIVTFRASCPSGVAFLAGGFMARRKETTIERIYREVTGRKMSMAIKRILLPKRAKRKAH